LRNQAQQGIPRSLIQSVFGIETARPLAGKSQRGNMADSTRRSEEILLVVSVRGKCVDNGLAILVGTHAEHDRLRPALCGIYIAKIQAIGANCTIQAYHLP